MQWKEVISNLVAFSRDEERNIKAEMSRVL